MLWDNYLVVFVRITYEMVTLLGFNAAAELPPFWSEGAEKKLSGTDIGPLEFQKSSIRSIYLLSFLFY